MASLVIGFLVEKYLACQSPKSDFGWHRFRFYLALCVRGLKSLKRFWPYLMIVWNGKTEQLFYLIFVFYMKLSVVYGAI